MHRIRTTLATTAILAAIMGTPLTAQDARLSGTVAETFGTEVIVDTGTDRLLVTLPDGAAAPALGARIDLTGTRKGARFIATDATVLAPADPAAAKPTRAGLPAVLRDLDLTNVRSRRDDDGETHHVGRLPGGGWLRAEARGDRLLEVQTDGAPLPDALVASMLPAAALAEPRFADIARLTEIDMDDDDEIDVEGYGADGMRIEIEFTRDGRLKSYERERDDRRSMTEAAARDRLVELGYTRIGFVERGGRHVTATAVNPYGERVEVRLDSAGRVERERARQR